MRLVNFIITSKNKSIRSGLSSVLCSHHDPFDRYWWSRAITVSPGYLSRCLPTRNVYGAFANKVTGRKTYERRTRTSWSRFVSLIWYVGSYAKWLSTFHSWCRYHLEDADSFADVLNLLCRAGYPDSSPELHQEFVRVYGRTRLPHGRPSKKRRFHSLHSICQNGSGGMLLCLPSRTQKERNDRYVAVWKHMILSETQVKVNVRIYFCFCPLDLYVFCLPSDLLRKSSAVVIEQAHWLGGKPVSLVMESENHVQFWNYILICSWVILMCSSYSFYPIQATE